LNKKNTFILKLYFLKKLDILLECIILDVTNKIIDNYLKVYMNHVNDRNILKLTDSCSGSMVRINKISGGERFRDKLLSMGLLPGRDIEVLSVRKNGPVIVKINDTRIAIGHGMASKIILEIQN